MTRFSKADREKLLAASSRDPDALIPVIDSIEGLVFQFMAVKGTALENIERTRKRTLDQTKTIEQLEAAIIEFRSGLDSADSIRWAGEPSTMDLLDALEERLVHRKKVVATDLVYLQLCHVPKKEVGRPQEWQLKEMLGHVACVFENHGLKLSHSPTSVFYEFVRRLLEVMGEPRSDPKNLVKVAIEKRHSNVSDARDLNDGGKDP